MPDGPFKNLKLGRRWSRFVTASHNEAFDGTQRCALASDALLRDMLTDADQALLTDLQTFERQPQCDLEALPLVKSLFQKRRKTAFAEILEKELSFRLSDRMTFGSALQRAIQASVDCYINRARNRIQEECIRARDSGEMLQDDYKRTVTSASTAFDAMSKYKICDALLTRDKNAFENDASKKNGIDEGPRL